MAELAVFHLRLYYITLREQVQLLFIIEGDKHLRAQWHLLCPRGRSIYPIKRLVSDTTLDCVKMSSLRLDRLFRILPSHTRQDAGAWLNAMKQEVDGSVCAAAWFSNLDRRAQSVTVTMGPDGVPGDCEGPPEQC